jgi:hypothetical protein
MGGRHRRTGQCVKNELDFPESTESEMRRAEAENTRLRDRVQHLESALRWKVLLPYLRPSDERP